MWFFALQPYVEGVLKELAEAIARRVAAVTRTPYKALVLDCDGVLWGEVQCSARTGQTASRSADTDPVAGRSRPPSACCCG